MINLHTRKTNIAIARFGYMGAYNERYYSCMKQFINEIKMSSNNRIKLSEQSIDNWNTLESHQRTFQSSSLSSLLISIDLTPLIIKIVLVLYIYSIIKPTVSTQWCSC